MMENDENIKIDENNTLEGEYHTNRPYVSPFTYSPFKNSLNFLQNREYCNSTSPSILETDFQTNPTFINDLCISKKLKKHKGCVNTIRWNENGSLLLSGSDDCNLCIWSGETFELLSCIETGHSNNIFGAQFVPQSNDRKIISSAADGKILIIDLDSNLSTNNNNTSHNSYAAKSITTLSSHYDIVMKFEFLPTMPHAILSTHQDGTVRLIDMRTKSREDQLIVKVKQAPCYGISFNPLSQNIFALSSGDYYVRIYDIRKPSRPYRNSPSTHCLQKFFPPEIENSVKKSKVSATDVQYNNENELLVNYTSSFDLVLFNASEKNWSEEFNSTNVKQIYRGRRNRDTFLKEAKFIGGGKYVATGSDNGMLFIWEKESGNLARKLPSDQFVVNGVAPHPLLPVIATCGIEHDVKIFQYLESEKVINFEKEFKEIATGSESRSLTRRLHFPTSEELKIVTINESEDLHAKADIYRKEGNTFFQNKEWNLAAEKYTKALQTLGYRPPNSQTLSMKESSRKLCLLNLAACKITLRDFLSAKLLCLQVLEIEPENEKALFRLSKSLLELNELENCLEIVQKARAIYPSNKDFVLIYNQLLAKQKKVQQKESELFKNLFT